MYKQVDSVAMGILLGPILAATFMVELERTLIPTLKCHLNNWYRFVDDTFCFINRQSVEYVLSILGNFHRHIQFRYELEHLGKLNFLDVQLIRNAQQLEIKVYRKQTNTDKYIHWSSFAPIQWKRSTLSATVHRVHTICSDQRSLDEQIFYRLNDYPNQFILNIMNQFKSRQPINSNEINKSINKYYLLVPYQGEKGFTIMKKLSKELRRTLPGNIKMEVTYTGTKLGSQFNIKYPIPKRHNHDIVYHTVCPQDNCNDDYIGEGARSLEE